MKNIKILLQFFVVIVLFSLLATGCGKSDNAEQFPMRDVAINAIRGGYLEDFSKIYEKNDMKVSGIVTKIHKMPNTDFCNLTVMDFVSGYKVYVSGIFKNSDVEGKGIKLGDTISVSIPYIKEANSRDFKARSREVIRINPNITRNGFHDKQAYGKIIGRYNKSLFEWDVFENLLWISYGKLEDIVEKYNGENIKFTGKCTLGNTIKSEDVMYRKIGFNLHRLYGDCIRLYALVPESEVQRLNIQNYDRISLEGKLVLDSKSIGTGNTIGLSRLHKETPFRTDAMGNKYIGFRNTVLSTKIWLNHKVGNKVSKNDVAKIEKLETEILSPDYLKETLDDVDVYVRNDFSLASKGNLELVSRYNDNADVYRLTNGAEYDFKNFIPENVAEISSVDTVVSKRGKKLCMLLLNIKGNSPIDSWLDGKFGSGDNGEYYSNISKEDSIRKEWSDSRISVFYWKEGERNTVYIIDRKEFQNI